MDILKVTIVQASLIWEDTHANLEAFSEKLSGIGKTDIILLPETFTTGFTMNTRKMAESMDGETVNWMKRQAAEKNAAIAGSAIILDKGNIHNRLLWVTPSGQVHFYDKRHLFTMGEEHLNFLPGTQKLIVEFRGWKICPLICYDLRFPVWSRNTEDYDILVYSANWPSARQHVWTSLLAARAIENQSYCFGVNRSGVDGMSVHYSGGSLFVNPKGETTSLGDGEKAQTFEISYSALSGFRNKFPVLKDRDSFLIKS